MAKINWAQHRKNLREDLLTLPHFFENPVQGMRHLPPWEWPTMITLQSALAILCSVIANFLERDFFGLITGIVVAPLMNVVLLAVGTALFHYFFLFAFKLRIPFRQIYLNLLFASIPLMVVTTVSFLLPPLLLLGSAAFFALLYVGFSDNFNIPRQPLRQLMIGMMVVYFSYWAYQVAQNTNRHKSLKLRASPESLDILEKELNP